VAPGLIPQEVLFIDDLPGNIAGAKAFGFATIEYSFAAHDSFMDAFLRYNICNIRKNR